MKRVWLFFGLLVVCLVAIHFLKMSKGIKLTVCLATLTLIYFAMKATWQWVKYVWRKTGLHRDPNAPMHWGTRAFLWMLAIAVSCLVGYAAGNSHESAVIATIVMTATALAIELNRPAKSSPLTSQGTN